jgi:inorganic triphosphatase YgiF
VAAHLEREIKLGAPAGFTLPDLGDVVRGRVRDSGVEPLETVYWDTPGLEVARGGCGLRHRRRLDRPDDPGVWTLKTAGSRQGDRVVRGEHEAVGDGSAPPRALLTLLPAGTDPARLGPVAVLRARRRVLTLEGPEGEGVEVMDDLVEVLDGAGGVAERFRELEVEVGERGDGLADRVAERLRSAGATPAETGSKYRRALRALGLDIPGMAEP